MGRAFARVEDICSDVDMTGAVIYFGGSVIIQMFTAASVWDFVIQFVTEFKIRG